MRYLAMLAAGLWSGLQVWGAQPPGEREIFSFETPAETAKISVAGGGGFEFSPRHYLSGQKSLEWSFQPGSQLTVNLAKFFIDDQAASAEYGNPALSLLAIHIYNEKALPGKALRIEFGRRGQSAPDCWFDFKLDFTGWRTGWVGYSRDMKGKPHPDMDYIRLVAPDAAGKLYFDDLIPCMILDKRHQEPSDQLPFVNFDPKFDLTETNGNPWLTRDLKVNAAAELTPDEVKGFRAVESHLDEDFLGENPLPLTAAKAQPVLEKLRKDFAATRIAEDAEGRISGRPIHFTINSRIYKDVRDGEKYKADFIYARDYGTLMLRLAQTWRNSTDPAVKAEVGKYYLLMVKHLFDQGYVYGSNMGGRMIAGYSTRELFGSLLLMRDFLAENGMREELFRMGLWHFDLNMMLDDKYFLLPNADYLNINLRSVLIAVLMLPDSPEKAARLCAFSKFASRNIGWETPGWMGGFKPDGTAFHHWGHYPAYIFGAMGGASAMVYYLSGTPYAISPEAVATLKRAVNAADVYINGNTAIALHGRNPYRSLPAAIVPTCAKPLAKAGDREMAALYKRTGGPRAAADKRFADVAPAPVPEGHWSFNYGGFGIHRLDGKMVTLKTHNHYIWAYETYTGENRFGRYLSNGTVEITPAAGPEAAGHVAEGWDWNRLPGATALHRPWDMLNAPPEKRIDMPTIVGNRVNGVSNLENRYGMMGTILAERNEPPRFDPSFKAVKSVFAFGPRIICLGNSIASESPYPVETTLFQYETKSKKRPVFVNSPKPELGEVKTELAAPCFAADADDNVYFVLGDGNRFEIRRGLQESRDKSTMAPNSGEFAVGWIDHGVKPAGAAYEYLIMLGMKPAEAPGYLARLKTDKPYRILRRDDQVHAVEDRPTGVTAAIFFAAQPELDWELLKKVNQPAYVMYRFREDGKLALSLNTPDLAGFIREGYCDLPPVTQDAAAENADRNVTVVLAGKWQLAAPVPGVGLAAEGKDTAVTGSFRHGIAKQLLLQRVL